MAQSSSWTIVAVRKLAQMLDMFTNLQEGSKLVVCVLLRRERCASFIMPMGPVLRCSVTCSTIGAEEEKRTEFHNGAQGPKAN